MKRHCDVSLKEIIGNLLNILLALPNDEKLVLDVLQSSKKKTEPVFQRDVQSEYSKNIPRALPEDILRTTNLDTSWNYPPPCIKNNIGSMTPQEAVHLIYSRSLIILQDQNRIGDVIRLMKSCLPLLSSSTGNSDHNTAKIFSFALDLIGVTPESERRKILPSNLCDMIFQAAIEPSIVKFDKDAQSRSLLVLRMIDHSYAKVVQEVEDIAHSWQLFHTLVKSDGEGDPSMELSEVLMLFLPNLIYFPESFELFTTVLVKEIASDQVQPQKVTALFDILFGLLNSSLDPLRIMTFAKLDLNLESIVRERQDLFCTELVLYEIAQNVAQCSLPILVAHVNLPDHDNFLLGFVWAVLNLSRQEDLAVWLAVMLANVNESIRTFASKDLFSILQRSEMPAGTEMLSDPLGFISGDMEMSYPLPLFDNQTLRKRTFEKQELCDLVKVLCSSDLFEKTRLSAGEQENNNEILSVSLKIITILTKNSKYARERCLQWQFLRILLGLIFNITPAVRAQAMICISCLSFALDKMQNLLYSKSPFQLEQLEVKKCQFGPEESLVWLPNAFRDKLLPFAHFKYYITHSGFCKAIKMLDANVQQAISKLHTFDKENALGDQIALQSSKKASLLIEGIENARSHESFLQSIETTLNYVCGRQELVNMFLLSTCKGSIARILCTLPADASDGQVLSTLILAIARALSCLSKGNPPPGAFLRFILDCVKDHLYPFVRMDSNVLDTNTSRELRRNFVLFCFELLSHDYDAGLRIVTPIFRVMPSFIPWMTSQLTFTTTKDSSDSYHADFADKVILDSIQIICLEEKDLQHVSQQIFNAMHNVLDVLTVFLKNYSSSRLSHAGSDKDKAAPLSFRRKALIRTCIQLISLIVQTFPSLCSEWVKVNIEFESIEWLLMFTEDREAIVRATTFSILSSISSCMISSNYVNSRWTIASESSLVLAPQHSEYLQLCMEKVLDANEAEYVRYQALMVVAFSLSDSPVDLEEEDETLDVLSSCSMRSSESLLMSSDSLQDTTGCKDAFDNVEIIGKNKAYEWDGFLRTRILNTISILERKEFLHFLGKLFSDFNPSMEKPRCLLLMACMTVLYNWYRVEPAKISGILADQSIFLGMQRLLDPMCILQLQNCPSQRPNNFREALHGSKVHFNTVIAGSIPCMLHGVSVLCKMLRSCIESNEELVLQVVHKSNTLKFSANLLRYRFSNQAADSRCSNLAWIHRQILNAELIAKTSLTSLLCSILRRSRIGFEASQLLVEHGVMEACLCMLLPCYHPSLNYNGCALLSYVTAHVSEVSDTSVQERMRIEALKSSEYKLNQSVNRQLSKRLLQIYHQLYETCEVENMSSHINIDEYKGAVVSAISSILSCSTQSKRFCLDVGFPDALISSLDSRLNQLLLHDLHGKNNSASREEDDNRSRRSFSMQSSRSKSKKTLKKRRIKRNIEQIEAEIVFILEMFKNLLYKSSEEIKSYLVNAGLPNIVARILSKSCSQTDKILTAIMQMLVNLVFECEEACKAMADGRSQGMSLLQLVMNSMGSVQASIDLWQDYMRVLSSCCSSWECLLLLLKSRVVSDVLTRIDEFVEAKNVECVGAALLFLVSLSFCEEGQVGILRSPQVVELLARTRCAFLLSGRIRHLVGLIFRNLTFLPAGKAHILNHAGAMEAIMEDLEMSSFVRESSSCRAIAANAVWSLLYLHEKSRAAIKANGFAARIQVVYESLASSQVGDAPDYSSDKSTMESLHAALKILDL
eukprot:232214-Hanusia_phi.AAC.4